MAAKKVGRGLISAGIGGIVLALIATLLFNERENIRPIQILCIEVALLAIIGGVFLVRREVDSRSQTRDILNPIMNLPVVVWALMGFLIVYVLLFIFPIFLSPDLTMIYLAGYIPNLNPVGNDLTVMVELIQGWVAGDQSPYTIQFYPPLTYVLFAPLLLLEDPLALFRFFTLFTFVSYCLLTLALPLRMIDRKHLSLALLIFVTGLLSYGFQFELERGQYNVFTFLLCLTSIYIFHYHPRYRLLAYLLFSISVQLKLYPAIFIVMFVDDWRDWKRVVIRFAALGLFNLLLFFVMGYQTFWDFLRSVSAQVVSPSWIGVWNHSISSFVSVFKQDGFGLMHQESLRVVRQNSAWVEGSLLLAFAILFLCALLFSHLRRKTGLDPYLLLACTIGALILPISYDYTLSILAAPMLLFLSAIPEPDRPSLKLICILLTLGISVVYFTILTPYNYRPYFLHNSFPLLFLLLILATMMNGLQYKLEKLQPVDVQDAH
ncbi:MAG TPA: glycosyltransferase 87 family protein [Anaerolineales bacterium]|nr:glycosyltransferase 87 family protein [Anaerolineales bacterium]